MISTENKVLNCTTADDDFTVEHYRQLLQLAKTNYMPACYTDIPWGNRFVLWRHDLDYSLNRGLSLARVEREVGVKATYFINPHSKFYNIAEASQFQIIQEILSLGHDLGLHFDAAFYDIHTEQELDRLVSQEADYLHNLFGIKPVAFSFHNPAEAHLTCEADYYGGLVNCYSRRFKTEVSYCSDSNGYWRFRRLHDVLTEGKDSCLQVLTHPGWWQENPMPPRQRIFRSALGRVAGIMRTYDEALQQHGRLNQTGAAEALFVLKDSLPGRFQLCDYLWNQEEFHTLFVELWRIHEAQINRLCKAQFRKEWAVPAHEVNAFFSSDGLGIDGWKLFNAVFEISWANAAGVVDADYQPWQRVRHQIVHGRSSIAPAELEHGCVAICEIIGRLAQWGRDQPIGYDGLAHLGSIGLPTLKTADGSLTEILDEVKDNIKAFPEKRWVALKLSQLKKPEDVKSPFA